MDSWRVATKEHPRSSIESDLRGSVPPGVKHSGHVLFMLGCPHKLSTSNAQTW